MIADRWNWGADEILHLPVRTREAYYYRVKELDIQERNASKK